MEKKPEARNPRLHRAIVRGLNKETRSMTEASYDGLVGTPPSWLPDPLHREFLYSRNMLCDRYGSALAKEILDAYMGLQSRPGSVRVRGVRLSEADRLLEALAYIKKIVELGEIEGIKAYLGKRGLAAFRAMLADKRARQHLELPSQVLDRTPEHEAAMADGRKRGALSNKTRSDGVKAKWAKIAAELWREKPGLKIDEVVLHIKNSKPTQGFPRHDLKPSGEEYSHRYIRDCLVGVQAKLRS